MTADASADMPVRSNLPAKRAARRRSDDLRISTCSAVKNEGPFLVEWVAWMHHIGATDLHIFTNDCTDGSDLILERLDEMGYLRHLPNPSTIMDTTQHQWTMLDFFNVMPRVKRSDWVMSVDVDEFIVVKTGAGKIADLVERLPQAQAIVLNQLHFGGKGSMTYLPQQLVTEANRWCQHPGPEESKRRRGVKTLIRSDAPVTRIMNHSPRLAPSVASLWVDGSGVPIDFSVNEPGMKGMDARHAAYDLAQLNHYPLRNAETFLVKCARGKVNLAHVEIGTQYWRKHDFAEAEDLTIQPHIPALRERVADMLSDPELFSLHSASCAHHRARINELRADEKFAKVYDEVLKYHQDKVLKGKADIIEDKAEVESTPAADNVDKPGRRKGGTSG